MSRKAALISDEISSKAVEIAKLAAELSELEKAEAQREETELGQWLARIYGDGSLTNIEFQQLRDEADRRVDALKQLYPQSTELAAFQEAADIAVQRMQTGILSFKKQKLPSELKTGIHEAYAFQVAYIQACLDRFTQTL
ncbi:hypothetical protein [Pseudomonas sp. NFR16]|uniref:hypothetical protein n=1 Tax=Pseudomonas sp. NFR16 TaxID=1566248 RepID=UPI0008B710E1|nr:hypothetical protein [Pseudomonas sp. NFR16]SEI72473.1 hypothetical protein SAMN03159495_1461 [Pseudomonas sp. NFR16]